MRRVITDDTNNNDYKPYTTGFTSALHVSDLFDVMHKTTAGTCCLSVCSSCCGNQEAQNGDGFERVVDCSSPPFLDGFQSRESVASDKMADVKGDAQELPTLQQHALVGRSLEFADALSCCDLGGPSDEWVAAFDSTVVPFDECAIHLELDSYSTSNPLPPPTSTTSTLRPPGENGKDYSGLSAMDTVEFGGEVDDWPLPACVQPTDAMMPPEARPPWENAAAADSMVVVCERVLPSRRPQTRLAMAPFAAPPAIVISEEACRRQLRPRR